MSSEALQPGIRLVSPAKSYTIISVLGRGGFGITYLASTSVMVDNLRMPAMVAIKEHFPADDCSRSADGNSVDIYPSAAKRYSQSLSDFRLEAKCLQRLAGIHPSIVSVSEVFDANSTAYYVMEYIEGSTLRQYVESRGPLSLAETLSIMQPITEAVARLHSNRFTHLDIKPGNIMLSADDSMGQPRPVLIDFGLAKHYNADGSSTVTVRSCGVTDGYAPVEQYAGVTRFSPTVDVYSLAATILFCLTGKKPLPAAEMTSEALQAAIPADLPGPARRALKAAMAYSPADRPANASVLLSQLAANPVSVSDDDRTRRVPPPGQPPKGPTRLEPEITTPVNIKQEKKKGISGCAIFLLIIAASAILTYIVVLIVNSSDKPASNYTRPVPAETYAPSGKYEWEYADTDAAAEEVVAEDVDTVATEEATADTIVAVESYEPNETVADTAAADTAP